MCRFFVHFHKFTLFSACRQDHNTQNNVQNNPEILPNKKRECINYTHQSNVPTEIFGNTAHTPDTILLLDFVNFLSVFSILIVFINLELSHTHAVFTVLFGETSTKLPSASTAERIMPSLSIPLSLRAGKLAIKHTCIPTNFSGSG